MGHRHYLLSNHSWHKSKQHDGKLERRPPPNVMNGDEILEQVNSLNFLVLNLDRLQSDIAFILCKFEKLFPLAFFDVMVHLAVHLSYEAKIVGPVTYSWMYPIERSLRTLKQYVRNKARPEGSIAKGFIMNEPLTFCSMYLCGIKTRFNRDACNDDSIPDSLSFGDFDVFRQNVRPLGGSISKMLTESEKQMAHWYVVNNSPEIASYLREHLRLIHTRSDRTLELHQRHRSQFPAWFKDHVAMQEEIRKSSEDGAQPTPKKIIYEQVLEKRSGHTKGLGWKATPNVATCTSTHVFEKDIGDKYEKLQTKVINLKEENACYVEVNNFGLPRSIH
ncbi:uncharacterized protein E6C27_scaffold43052G001590 [Cucumis melo var. makuwa]|uniref:DUF4218 domain-containing protein n=2 Tax=Cucumis melo TaxID=3656 RepID=A0A5A7UKB8_CUCMM|nr:uncharacterized protein E6C27_scaffold43052G001590 [Cucumis melo var. makuwa]